VPPKDIAIFAQSQDSHACAVDYVLRAMGHRPILFNTSERCNGAHFSVGYDDQAIHLRIGDFVGPLDRITSSWNRRVSKTSNLPDFTHPADRSYVQDNAHSTLMGMLRLLDRRFAVNPIATCRVHSNKLAQLEAAAASGFRIPKTIISNKYEDIDDFLGRVGEACFKSYFARGWLTDSGPVHAMTTRLRRGQNPDKEAYELMPHIYQEFIPKKAEYRLTLFGLYAAAVKIDTSRLDAAGVIDWRANPLYRNAMSHYELPAQVVDAARKVMRALGLRFGTFDIAETADGEFYFFEVNEEGQWLWVELSCPEAPLLQPFCEFLASADDNFIWSASRARADYNADAICGIIDVESSGIYKHIFDSVFPDSGSLAADERNEVKPNHNPEYQPMVGSEAR